jgi:1-acyl-sn-glycerol-3-phosphate acyltransferase
VLFRFCYVVVRFVLGIWHPFFRVKGRENLPADGEYCYLICGNHSAMSDPIWVLFALRTNRMEKVPRIMAKAELMRVPVLGRLFRWVGVFGVERGENDITALKTALKTLKDGKSLMIFPQGTRCRNGERLPGKNGVAMMATRTDTMVLPVYLTEKKRPFRPLTCVIGQPYRMEYAGKRATSAELDALTADMMDRIYALGEQA